MSVDTPLSTAYRKSGRKCAAPGYVRCCSFLYSSEPTACLASVFPEKVEHPLVETMTSPPHLCIFFTSLRKNPTLQSIPITAVIGPIGFGALPATTFFDSPLATSTPQARISIPSMVQEVRMPGLTLRLRSLPHKVVIHDSN